MKQLLARLRRMREIVVPFAPWEMVLMRLLCSVHFYDTLPQRIPFATMPFPNGLGHLLDFTFLAEPGLWPILKGLSIPCLIAYTLGRFNLLALTYLLALIVSFGTLRNSQGAIGHSTQLLALVMLAQWAMSFIDVITKERKTMAFWRTDTLSQRRLIHAARVMIAAAYLTTAISKIDRSHGQWLLDTPNLSVQMVKTQANDYYNTLEPIKPAIAEKLPDLIAAHPHLARIFFAPALFLELFFFLGLLGRGWSAVMGLAAIALHRTIELLMGLNFESHEILLWIFFVNVPYWLWRGTGLIIESLRPGPHVAAG
jgi:hypothetical protein